MIAGVVCFVILSSDFASTEFCGSLLPFMPKSKNLEVTEMQRTDGGRCV